MFLGQGTPVNIIVGSQVWLEDPDAAWIDGEVSEIRDGSATIVATNGRTVSPSPELVVHPFSIPELAVLTLDTLRHYDHLGSKELS